jgi:signal transduction histidine kinase
MKKIIAAQQSYAKTKGLSEVCSLEEIVETALEIAGIRLRDANIEVVKDCGDLRPGLFDRHQILQILVNLIGNARHALQESARPQKTLTITAAEDSEGFVLEVRDNGIGIAPENLPKVFTHGFTTKKTGHGFGLHNCANAAQEMDGSLTAFSDGPGQGARFVLRLPAQPAETGARETGSYGRSPHV